MAIGMTWLVVYAHLAAHVRSVRFRGAVEAVSGAVLVALGARLAVDRG